LPEGGPYAPILIATSWQALNRAIQGRQDMLLCNCTVVILFAGFYVEANLNYLVEQLRMKKQMETFLNKNYPGLQDKLSWFYNEFVARSKTPNRKTLYNRGILKKIRRRFPGFAKLYKFRNDISHGVINKSAQSLEETKELRQQAKDMVAEFFRILRKHGYDIPRNTTYYQAITS
jgi:hypothetical protein